jgi:hypothetical protein
MTRIEPNGDVCITGTVISVQPQRFSDDQDNAWSDNVLQEVKIRSREVVKVLEINYEGGVVEPGIVLEAYFEPSYKGAMIDLNERMAPYKILIIA